MDETKAWLTHLQKHKGLGASLMAKMSVGVGLRADEIIHFREEQLPPLPTDGRKEVKMTVCYGTKGQRSPQDLSKRGKERSVLISTDLLIELHLFRDTTRKLTIRRVSQRLNDWEPPEELFFSGKTGRAFSYKRFYEIWKCGPIPFAAFSPHIGRHMWACYTLITKMAEDFEIITKLKGPSHAAVDQLIANMIRIWITPQLGHVDEKTTLMYILWVREVPDLVSFQDQWWDYLNEPL
ncbi:hypothetical protein WG901_13095 [Novosphingobium sp. PS1R-30]|uniref:Tyr recombinase domain-containing protein n=1 Tax=Novosphingobium anseongense TaxID=3133436 RepID=A0ABU8RWW7_9SPHN